MRYEDVTEWTRLCDLVCNRVSVINQMLGARYDGCMDNPCSLSYRRGSYRCKLCGEVYCTFRLYDLDSTYDALRKLDNLNDGLWFLKRSGRLNFTEYQPTAQLI